MSSASWTICPFIANDNFPLKCQFDVVYFILTRFHSVRIFKRKHLSTSPWFLSYTLLLLLLLSSTYWKEGGVEWYQRNWTIFTQKIISRMNYFVSFIASIFMVIFHYDKPVHLSFMGDYQKWIQKRCLRFYFKLNARTLARLLQRKSRLVEQLNLGKTPNVQA